MIFRSDIMKENLGKSISILSYEGILVKLWIWSDESIRKSLDLDTNFLKFQIHYDFQEKRN